MPNWTYNTMTITSDSHTLLEKIKNELIGENELLDFNKVIPMPETMNVISGSYEEDRLKYYCLKTNTPMPENLSHYFPYLRYMTKKNGEEYTLKDYEDYLKINENKKPQTVYESYPDTRESWLMEGEKIYINITKYGYKDWYDWCTKHWNTKWNACDTNTDETKNELIYHFNTAWNAPIPVAKEISKKYKVKVTLYSEYEDYGERGTEYTFVNGEEKEYKEYPSDEDVEDKYGDYDDWSDEAYDYKYTPIRTTIEK